MTQRTIRDTAPNHEAQWLAKARAGNIEAYNKLYEMHLPKVYGLCYRLTGDASLAEDATQEVFIQVWKDLQKFRGESQFSTWLHRVASNTTISYMRKQRGWLKRVLSNKDTIAEMEPIDNSLEQVDLESYVKRLPERARVVFVLHAIEGYRHEEIAALTHMAVGSSKAHFHRAKQLLEEWML